MGNQTYQLQPWSYWGQRWDPSPEPDPDRFYNCGPECLAMCIYYWSGVEIQAAYIHDVIHGRDYVGGTTLQDMRAFLRRKTNTPTDLLFVPDTALGRASLFMALHSQLSQGYPSIGLRAFSAPYRQPLHYGVIVGSTPDRLIEADPWDGMPRNWAYNDYWSWSWNALLLPHRKRAIGVP